MTVDRCRRTTAPLLYLFPSLPFPHPPLCAAGDHKPGRDRRPGPLPRAAAAPARAGPAAARRRPGGVEPTAHRLPAGGPPAEGRLQRGCLGAGRCSRHRGGAGVGRRPLGTQLGVCRPGGAAARAVCPANQSTARPSPSASPALSTPVPVQPLVELHIFAGARRVVEALRAHDCGPALAWCEEQRARLRKAKSRLEFKLRVQVGWVAGEGWGWGLGGLRGWRGACMRGGGCAPRPTMPRPHPPLPRTAQEFVELVRSGQQLEAIAYARRHLAPWAVQYLPELQVVPLGRGGRGGVSVLHNGLEACVCQRRWRSKRTVARHDSPLGAHNRRACLPRASSAARRRPAGVPGRHQVRPLRAAV